MKCSRGRVLMGNKQSNCLVKARAPFDPLLWNQDDVENIAAAYKESAPKDGMVTPDDMARVLQELDGADCCLFHPKGGGGS